MKESDEIKRIIKNRISIFYLHKNMVIRNPKLNKHLRKYHMLKIVEAFSGIGAQREALIKSQIKYKVLNTIEWDISAIYAYD